MVISEYVSAAPACPPLLRCVFFSPTTEGTSYSQNRYRVLDKTSRRASNKTTRLLEDCKPELSAFKDKEDLKIKKKGDETDFKHNCWTVHTSS